ncbi:MAG TPA: L-threonylcarbamoyladenylate synthase [bacterium]|nr:L-threonylcarbamoyladenylate synthase [bacterium]
MARIIELSPDHPQPRLVSFAVSALRDDGLVAYPTDTTYGIGASLMSKKAIERIYTLKPHKKKKPLTFLCSDLKDISRYALVPDGAYRIMRKLTPGPFTFILQATREVPRLVMTPRKTVGIRVPDNVVSQAIISELGNPIIGTTAMNSGREYMDDPSDINDSIGHALDFVIDAGIIPYELSTIIDFTQGDEPVIIREGKGDPSPAF